MNGGSARGSAVGFKLNNLLTVGHLLCYISNLFAFKLSDIKSADNKSSLLHYIVAYLQQNYSETLTKCEDKFKLAEAVSRSMCSRGGLVFTILSRVERSAGTIRVD